MNQFFVDPSAIDGNTIRITGGDVNHIRNVLRMKSGDELVVKTGDDGKEYHCGIKSVSPDEVICELFFIGEQGVELESRISLYQGLPKSDKLELVIQKAVELGAYEIIPVAMKRSVVKLDEKKAASKLSRWQAIADSAAKQSRRAILPVVHPVMSFEDAARRAAGADVALLPYELAQDMEYTKKLISSIKPGQSVSVMIGPEGGFDPAETALAQQLGIEMITLGRRILRTETAGLTVLSVLMYELEGKKDGDISG